MKYYITLVLTILSLTACGSSDEGVPPPNVAAPTPTDTVNNGKVFTPYTLNITPVSEGRVGDNLVRSECSSGVEPNNVPFSTVVSVTQIGFNLQIEPIDGTTSSIIPDDIVITSATGILGESDGRISGLYLDDHGTWSFRAENHIVGFLNGVPMTVDYYFRHGAFLPEGSPDVSGWSHMDSRGDSSNLIGIEYTVTVGEESCKFEALFDGEKKDVKTFDYANYSGSGLNAESVYDPNGLIGSLIAFKK